MSTHGSVDLRLNYFTTPVYDTEEDRKQVFKKILNYPVCLKERYELHIKSVTLLYG
jgi:hypothetical protein